MLRDTVRRLRLGYYRVPAVRLRFGVLAREADAIKTRDLHYDLPPELIAQEAREPRDAARLLVLHRNTGRIEHRIFRDLPEYLRPPDCLVVNTTRVIPAKFACRRTTGGRINGLFIREESPGRWVALLAGGGRLKPAERLTTSSPEYGLTFLERRDRGECLLEITPPKSAAQVLEAIGEAPLPPYIHRGRNRPAELIRRDLLRYQTIYANEAGAVAAPTAGMHFTAELRQRLEDYGIAFAELVLHVGLGTFQPVEVEDLRDHPMHREWFSLPSAAVDRVTATRAAGGRCVAVGTTSVRVLETCAASGSLRPQSGWTSLCIYPPYEFRVTDALVTNFHLPGSTLLALVFAFAGREQTLHAYEMAIREQYRFYSYGDAMLIV